MINLIHILAAGVTDDDGAILSGGTVLTYEAGTTTLKTTYQEFELETPHANPLTLDDAGRAVVYAQDRVKLVIMDSDGNSVRTIDDVGISDSDISSAATEAVAGVGLVGASDGSIDVNVDGTTITINADDQVQIPDNVVLPGSPSTEADFTVGDDLVVTDDASVAGTLTVTEEILLASNSNGSIKPSNATKIMLKKGGASGERPLVVSANPSSAGIMTVGGSVSDAGALVTGEGYTPAQVSTGRYTLTWTDAFASAPRVTVTALITGAGPIIAVLENVGTTVATVYTFNAAGTLTDAAFHFMAEGQRGA